MRLTRLFGLILVLAMLMATPALAQDRRPPTDDEVNAIARRLYCPVCENTPLDVCPTQACAQWRALIRQMLSEGKTEQEIFQYFVDNYGARVLEEPPRQGFFWLAYLIPPLLILGGVMILARTLRAMKRTGVAASASGPDRESLSEEYLRRLEEELRRQD